MVGVVVGVMACEWGVRGGVVVVGVGVMAGEWGVRGVCACVQARMARQGWWSREGGAWRKHKQDRRLFNERRD